MPSHARRENIPVTEREQSVLEQLLREDSVERRALVELAGEVGTSRASVAHAVLAVGMDTMRAKVREIGYAELAASYSAEELAERRAEVASRRERAADRWGQE